MTPDEFYQRVIDSYRNRGCKIVDIREKFDFSEVKEINDCPEVEIDSSRRSLTVFSTGLYFLKLSGYTSYIGVDEDNFCIQQNRFPFGFEHGPVLLSYKPEDAALISGSIRIGRIIAITPHPIKGFPLEEGLQKLLFEAEKDQDFKLCSVLRDLRNELYPQ